MLLQVMGRVIPPNQPLAREPAERRARADPGLARDGMNLLHTGIKGCSSGRQINDNLHQKSSEKGALYVRRGGMWEWNIGAPWHRDGLRAKIQAALLSFSLKTRLRKTQKF